MGLSMRRMGKALLAALVLLGLAMPAAAQFSDSYNFIKAVRDKDGVKAQEILDKPGSNTIINARDNDSGDAAIHITVRRTDAPWMGFLLRAGANPNVRDREGNTPLMLATQVRWTEGLQLLLGLRVQVDAQNRLGETALLKATQARDLESVKLLLEARASPDVADNSGRTARAFAATDPRGTSIAKLFSDVPVKKQMKVQGPSL
jgi:ankyrin repeat protein